MRSWENQQHILTLDPEIAQVWGRLRVPHPENSLDKQVAATALVYDLTSSPGTRATLTGLEYAWPTHAQVEATRGRAGVRAGGVGGR